MVNGRKALSIYHWPFTIYLFFLFTIHALFLVLNLDALALDVKAQAIVDAHVLIGDPDERKPRQKVSAPVRHEQFVASDYEEDDCHVMAEAVFAGEEVEEFSLDKSAAGLALSCAELARLSEHFLMRHSPSDARDWYGKQE